MTTITLIKNQDNEITAFTADGHTNYGTEGEDIVCAAASSVIQTAAMGILMVAKTEAKLTRDDKRGYFALTLPKGLDSLRRHDCNVILNTMAAGLADIAGNYSDFVEIVTEDLKGE
jgi:uncharacterized protein YsxB (DUF464 family)